MKRTNGKSRKKNGTTNHPQEPISEEKEIEEISPKEFEEREINPQLFPVHKEQRVSYLTSEKVAESVISFHSLTSITDQSEFSWLSQSLWHCSCNHHPVAFHAVSHLSF